MGWEETVRWHSAPALFPSSTTQEPIFPVLRSKRLLVLLRESWSLRAFVAKGGFSSYSFASATDLTVTDGTELVPTQKVLATADIQKLQSAPTGSDIYTFTSPTLQPQFERKPTNLTLTANQTIVIGEGAAIYADPGAALTLKATPLRIVQADTSASVAATSIEVLGTLDAPAGTITLDGGFPADSSTFQVARYSIEHHLPWSAQRRFMQPEPLC